MLDALLARQPALSLDMVVGASAGALNGLALLYGLHLGGAEQARTTLKKVWDAVADANLFSPLKASWFERMLGGGRMSDWHPGVMGLDALMRSFTPQQFNPFGLNPMRDLLAGLFDTRLLADALARPDLPRLVISATDVVAGKATLFTGPQITLDVVVASTTLPFLSPPVRLGGRDYWDGSYSGNPPLSPIIDQGRSPHLLIIDITADQRPEPPTTPSALFDRLTEIGMNGMLDAEIAGIERINRLIASGLLSASAPGVRPITIHRLHGGTLVSGHPGDKLNADAAFLEELRGGGAKLAREWLVSQRL